MAVEDHFDNDEEGRRPFKSGEQGGGGGGGDEELTSLSWLQDTDLLKDFRMGGGSGDEGEGSSSGDSPDCPEETVEHVIIQEDVEECGGGEQNVEPVGGAHTPYDPTLHAHSKPPFSFSCLIFMAIEASPRKALPVKDIYGWILGRFPYFQGAPSGWKNSVRHNLSLSKCFRKVDKEKGQNVGKGSLWCIDQEFRPNLLQALQKAPSMANLEFSQFSCSPSALPPYCHNGRTSEGEIKPCLLVAAQEAIQIPSPDPEVDAAATMLTLKNGPAHSLPQNVSEESENDSIPSHPKFSRKRLRLKQSHHSGSKRARSSVKPVVTISPSEDHTYSACPEDNNNNGGHNENGHSALEEEGAHALMNLAEAASKRLLRKVS